MRKIWKGVGEEIMRARRGDWEEIRKIRGENEKLMMGRCVGDETKIRKI